VLERIRAWAVQVGDHEDFETLAHGADLVVSNSHARQAVERLGVELVRAGFPTFDRLGAGHRVVVGYRGTCDLVFEIGNIFLHHDHTHHAQPPVGTHGITEGGHAGTHAAA
jgi:nitrogenase molybdenum-iron protein NifN